MKIEKEVFKKYIVDYKKLEEYGFIRSKNLYSFKCNILDNSFEVNVIIDNECNINGKVIDLLMNEEYTNIYSQMDGLFVNKVRTEYKSVLLDIRNNCFIPRLFISNQANRITKYIKDKYNVEPEFLFDDDSTGVFRKNISKKWFGIIMNISYSKLDKKDGEVEVINLKIDDKKILELIKKKGYYKAYHMSKKYWITVVLDDTLDDKEVIELVDESYGLVK